MLPSLSPLPKLDAPASPLAAPSGFRGVKGLLSARRAPPLGLEALSSRGRTPAQLAGLKYEKRVKDSLRVHFPALESGPWFQLEDAFGLRVCQPDILLLSPLCLIEVKAHHDLLAWWQLRKLYAPVVERVVGSSPVCCEITGSFDPSVPWPEEPQLLWSFEEFSSWLKAPKGFGVFQWRI